jgi:hypothetical protein
VGETSTDKLATQDPPPQSRARLESQQWAAEKRQRIEDRLTQLLGNYERQKELLDMPESTLMAGIERWYSAAEAARFFNRSNQWIYDRFNKGKFRYRNGEPIVPIYTNIDVKKPRARFTLELIREMALSLHRDGPVKMDELKIIMGRVAAAELGEVLYTDDE